MHPNHVELFLSLWVRFSLNDDQISCFMMDGLGKGRYNPDFHIIPNNILRMSLSIFHISIKAPYSLSILNVKIVSPDNKGSVLLTIQF